MEALFFAKNRKKAAHVSNEEKDMDRQSAYFRSKISEMVNRIRTLKVLKLIYAIVEELYLKEPD